MKTITINMKEVSPDLNGSAKGAIKVINEYVRNLNSDPLNLNNGYSIESSYELYSLVGFWRSHYFEELQRIMSDVEIVPGIRMGRKNILETLDESKSYITGEIDYAYNNWVKAKAAKSDDILQVLIVNSRDINGTPQLFFKGECLVNVEKYINDDFVNWKEKVKKGE